MRCKYCGYEHGIIGDVVCRVSFNKGSLPIVQVSDKEPFFALEVALKNKKNLKSSSKEPRSDEGFRTEFKSHMEKIGLYNGKVFKNK